jgi:transposase
VLLTKPNSQVEREVRTFGAMTADVLALSGWLAVLGVRQIAMESTGVFWRPIFNLLEDDARSCILVNPLHMRAVPGRKTDVKDSERLADVLRHAVVQPSFIPPTPIRELRELIAIARRSSTSAPRRSTASRSCWMEGATSTLAAAATRLLGKSARDVLEYLQKV